MSTALPPVRVWNFSNAVPFNEPAATSVIAHVFALFAPTNVLLPVAEPTILSILAKLIRLSTFNVCMLTLISIGTSEKSSVVVPSTVPVMVPVNAPMKIKLFLPKPPRIFSIPSA